MDAHGTTVEACHAPRVSPRFDPVHVGFTVDPPKVAENERRAAEYERLTRVSASAADFKSWEPRRRRLCLIGQECLSDVDGRNKVNLSHCDNVF